MPKYFVDSENIKGNIISIAGEEAKHILSVMRMSTGDEIVVCDGKNHDFLCRIAETGKGFLEAEIVERHLCETEAETEITLFQGLPKSDKMEFIIQKCVEIGVKRIVPVSTERAVVKIEKGGKEEKKLERWRKIAEAAAKQSGRGIIPDISGVISFSEAVKEASFLENAIIPYENEKETGIKDFIKKAKKGSVGIFIGPEGGLSENEIKTAVENGIVPVTLGKRILRTETAGMVACAIILYELG